MRPFFELSMIAITLTLTGCAYETFERHQNSMLSCRESHLQCLSACHQENFNKKYKHEKCDNDCEKHYNTCLEAVPPVVVEQVAPVAPVIIELYPYTGWWRGWRPHYYRHWR